MPLLFPVGALALGLVLLGHDLGTTLILLMVLAALLFAAGAPARMFVTAGLASAALVAVFVVTSENRMARLGTWLHCTDSLGACMQPIHGKYALADGGFWGVGLGASREKWSWLPEAHNDFIFAIIGEEPRPARHAGGARAVPRARVRLLPHGDPHLRPVRAHRHRRGDGLAARADAGQRGCRDRHAAGDRRAAAAGVERGSALIVTLVLLGMLMSFARHEPGCRDVLAARPGLVRRGLAVVPGARRRVAGRTARSGRTVAS
ncbi:hypothetical protein GCM10025868_06680 [Angustibacter aerolatus]|uniref:Probable peptidoglycan glycosyltransferase FtsW n=1 Tax=Angustibacter aerolatus TaxID=1162965 RepID=A0ABQ6JB67_9ACTN|nr:hypothetical protein GCM10025868_06680 [Angustibacter aerolatus]